MTLLEWHKLESASDPDSAGSYKIIVGTGGTYGPAKYGNGMAVTPADVSNLLQFKSIPLSAPKFTIEFWFKANFNYSDIAADPLKLIMWYKTGGNGDVGLAWESGAFCIDMFTAFGGAEPFASFANGVNFSTGDIIHIALSYDNTASSGNTMRVWMNGIELTKNSESSANYPLTVLSIYPAAYFGGGYSVDGFMDNLKVWDGLKTNFDDRVFESDGIPLNVTASKGTYIDHVAVSWDTVIGDSIQYQVQRATSSGGSYSDIGTWQSGTTYNDSSPIDGTHYFYKVKARSTVNNYESALSAYDEGYINFTPVPVGPTLVKDIPSIKKSSILINGFDIYKKGYVAKMFNISEEKTFKRSKLIFNDFTLNVKNFDNLFSRDNPKSVFYGQKLFMPVQVYNRSGLQIFNGITLNLTRDHLLKTASIQVSDRMAMFAKMKIQYVSSDWETPATAVKNIMDLYGISDLYDSDSINQSDALYKLANAYIKCDIKLNNNTYLTPFIEKLAEIGCADAFIHNNKIRFDHWKIFDKPASSLVNLTIKDHISAPVISILSSEIVNDYRIRYSGDNGIPVTDQTANNIGALSRSNLSIYSLPEIRTGEDSQIAIKDKFTAIYFGECLIRRTHTRLSMNPNPLQVIEFTLRIQDSEWIDILSHFTLTFSEEGWDKKIFEVMKIVIDDDANRINLTAYEVAS